jgi:hypothetical protein
MNRVHDWLQSALMFTNIEGYLNNHMTVKKGSLGRDIPATEYDQFRAFYPFIATENELWL